MLHLGANCCQDPTLVCGKRGEDFLARMMSQTGVPNPTMVGKRPAEEQTARHAGGVGQ
jgi:hypothetical protein